MQGRPMALGGAPSLVLLLGAVCLWNGLPLEDTWAQEVGDEEQVGSAPPPNLVALAKATVAAGNISAAAGGNKPASDVDALSAQQGIVVSQNPVAQQGWQRSEVPAVQRTVPEEAPQVYAVVSQVTVAQEVATTTPGTSSGKEALIIVGDTHYAWQDWSKWHCNCPEGSMSRVRDITYSAPGIQLDPNQYNVLRFQREVCSYQVCMCDRGSHECDRLAVTCSKGPMHLCALEDIKQDQAHERERFWHRIFEGLKTLWQVIRNTFPEDTKEKDK